MPLNDYEFKLDDTGVVLNADSTGVPFVDVQRVSGLDSAPYRETIRDHEGTDGGFIDAEFERGRDVILDGTVYCDTSNVETYLDDLKENFGPVTAPIPFYFKAPGVAERLLFVKPRGVRFDWDLARRIGVTEAQFLMYAEDPRIYDSTLSSTSIPFGGSATTGFGFTNVLDSFTRTVSAGGWGTLDTSETWTDSATQLSVNGTTGRVSHDVANQSILNTLSSPTGVADGIVRSAVRFPAVAAGGFVDTGVRMRVVDASNYYYAAIRWETTGQAQIILRRVVAGSTATIAGPTNLAAYDGSQTYLVEIECMGSEIRARGWIQGGTYPTSPSLAVVDTNFTTGGIGIRSLRASGNTNSGVDTIFDDFQVYRGIGFNLSFGATVPASGGTVIVTGNRPTPGIITLNGPIVNPAIYNTTDSKSLVFTGLTLGAPDTLVIDLANKTVVQNGTTNRRANLITAEWFIFNPGSTFLILSGTSGSGSMIVEYRNAWR